MQTLPSGRMEELFKLLQIVAQTFRIFPVCCTKLPKKQHALAHHDTVFAHRALPPLSFSLSLSLSLPCCPSLTDFQPHIHTHTHTESPTATHTYNTQRWTRWVTEAGGLTDDSAGTLCQHTHVHLRVCFDSVTIQWAIINKRLHHTHIQRHMLKKNTLVSVFVGSSRHRNVVSDPNLKFTYK